MRERRTSPLGGAGVLVPAVLLLVAVALAVWIVSELARTPAAAEQLSAIVVGSGATAPGAAALRDPGEASAPVSDGTVPGSGAATPAGGDGTGRVSSSGEGAASTSLPPADAVGPTTTRPTPAGPTPATTSPGTSVVTGGAPTTLPAAPSTTRGTAAPPTTMRMVVPDPVREHMREHGGRGTAPVGGGGGMGGVDTQGH